MTAPTPYPVRLEGHLDPQLSRWKWLVKWLLIVPHAVILVFLWAAFVVLSLAAAGKVAFTGRYPRAIFDFNLGVLRWSWRVGFYAYSALGTDRYPPFTLDDVADYPARLDVPYPERLPRGWRLVKWWLVAVPHYLVALALIGTSPAVITVVAIAGGVMLLFTGRYPRELFAFELGLDRWVLRAAAYAALMTDAYPPFRLDAGETDVGILPPAAPRPAARRPRPVLLVAGALAGLLGLGLLGAGGALVATDRLGRDADGFLAAPAERYATDTYALTTRPAELHLDGPDWLHADALLGSVRLRVTAPKPVFVGIARSADVDAFLSGVGHAEVDGKRVPGAAPMMAPASVPIWAASTTGRDEQLTWKARDGRWTVVAANADGSRAVAARVTAAATLPALGWIGAGILTGGLIIGGVAVAAVATAARGRD